MSETLISGYASFTSAEEFGAAPMGEGPATILSTTVTVLFTPSAVVGSVLSHC